MGLRKAEKKGKGEIIKSPFFQKLCAVKLCFIRVKLTVQPLYAAYFQKGDLPLSKCESYSEGQSIISFNHTIYQRFILQSNHVPGASGRDRGRIFSRDTYMGHH